MEGQKLKPPIGRPTNPGRPVRAPALARSISSVLRLLRSGEKREDQGERQKADIDDQDRDQGSRSWLRLHRGGTHEGLSLDQPVDVRCSL